MELERGVRKLRPRHEDGIFMYRTKKKKRILDSSSNFSTAISNSTPSQEIRFQE
jgi:hypothetical protein